MKRTWFKTRINDPGIWAIAPALPLSPAAISVALHSAWCLNFRARVFSGQLFGFYHPTKKHN